MISRSFLQVAPESVANSTCKLWRYTGKDLGPTPKFDCGIFTLSLNSRTSLPVSSGALDRRSEYLFVVARGSAKCNYEGGNTLLIEESDCIYFPPGTSCEIQNTGGVDLVLGWVSSVLDKPDGSESKSVQVIKTLRDVTPVTLTIKGLERDIYRIKQTRGFHFAVFKRGAQTYSPLHTHEPPYFEEAFIVLRGKLWVTGLDGNTNALNDFDFAYVSPYGGNLNENRSNEGVTYAWIGAPPVNMKEIPVEQQFSKSRIKI